MAQASIVRQRADVATERGALPERRARRALFIARAYAIVAFTIIVAWSVYEQSLSPRANLIGDMVMAVVIVAGALVVTIRSRLARERAAEAARAAIEEVSKRDELTGLYNYRVLREQIEAHISGEGAACAVIMTDLNGFKEINDHFGHVAGDAVLRAVGGAIKGCVGDRGLVVRYGGDEFVVILPRAGQDVAAAVADQVVAAVLAVPLDGTPVKRGGAVSTAYGIAVYPGDGQTAEMLIAAADRTLYDEKARVRATRERAAERHAQDVFYAIGDAVGQSLDAQETVNNLVRAVGETLGVDVCAIRLVDEHGMIPVRAVYVSDRELRSTLAAVELDRPLTTAEAVAHGLLDGQPMYTDEATTSEHVPARYRPAMAPGTWILNIPLPAPREGMLQILGRHQVCAPPPTSLAYAISRLASAAIRNCDVYEMAREQSDKLTALAGIGGLLFGEGDFEERLGAISRRIVEVTGFDVVTLDTIDPEGKKPFCRHFHARSLHGHGGGLDEASANAWRFARPQLTHPETADFLARVRDVIVIEDAQNSPLIPDYYRRVVVDTGTKAVVVCPIVWQDELKGVLYFSAITRDSFTESEIVLMRTLAAQLAPSVQVALMHVELQRSYDDLKAAHLEAIVRLAYAAEARDPYTESNLNRIKAISQAMARRMGIDGELLEGIGYGAIVHDLGKLRIPDSILVKPGELDDDEWKVMKMHPIYGAELIGNSAFYEVARQTAYYHHERWDGSGYPFGLKGEEIPLAARIIAIADVYDALTTARPYKTAWPLERALGELRDMRGTKLCPQSIDVFLALWKEGVIAEIDAQTGSYGLERRLSEEAAA